MIVNASGRRGIWASCVVARALGLSVAWVHHMIDGRDHRRAAPRRLGGRMEGLQLWRMPQAIRHMLAGAAATAVVTSNEADAEAVVRWHRVSRKRLWLIPPGVDTDEFSFDASGRARLRAAWGAVESTCVVGTAARLVDGKGVDTLIDAIVILRAQGLDVVGVIAGDGPERRAFVQHTERCGVAPHVRFLGTVAEMPAFHSACDVGVLASVTESFGLALTEAMACERPVIATPTAGGSRQIEHRRSGWLLRGFAAPELASAIAALQGDPGLCRRIGQAGREAVVNSSSIDLTLRRTLEALWLRTTGVPADRQNLRLLPAVR